jgi:hypothetical protein
MVPQLVAAIIFQGIIALRVLIGRRKKKGK